MAKAKRRAKTEAYIETGSGVRVAGDCRDRDQGARLGGAL